MMVTSNKPQTVIPAGAQRNAGTQVLRPFGPAIDWRRAWAPGQAGGDVMR
jgi:hypothetical protein